MADLLMLTLLVIGVPTVIFVALAAIAEFPGREQ